MGPIKTLLPITAARPEQALRQGLVSVLLGPTRLIQERTEWAAEDRGRNHDCPSRPDFAAAGEGTMEWRIVSIPGCSIYPLGRDRDHLLDLVRLDDIGWHEVDHIADGPQ